MYITTSAPKSKLGRWKIKFLPPLSGPDFGDVICIILDWVGNYIFYHECMRRAATCDRPLGPLASLLVPTSLAPSKKALRGLLTKEVITMYEKAVGFTLDCSQRQALWYMNEAAENLFFVRGLTGTGKTVVSCAIQFACKALSGACGTVRG